MSEYTVQIQRLIEEKRIIQEFLLGQGYCVICGHSDPLDLEAHHLGRKRNAPDFTITCCRNCHGRFTRKQRWWPIESLRKNNPPILKEAFVLRSTADALLERSRLILQYYGIK